MPGLVQHMFEEVSTWGMELRFLALHAVTVVAPGFSGSKSMYGCSTQQPVLTCR